MTAAKKDFVVFKNEDWRYSTRLKKSDGSYHDLTGRFVMQIRPTAESDEIILELSTDNGRLFFDADQVVNKGRWGLVVESSVLAQLPAGEFEYDLLWISGTFDRRALEGKVQIKEGATR